MYTSDYEYYFVLQEKDVHDYYQQLVAEDAGIPAPDDPFSFKRHETRVNYEEDLDIEERGEQE